MLAFLCCWCDGGQPCETQPLLYILAYWYYLCQHRERERDLDHQVFIGCTKDMYYVLQALDSSVYLIGLENIELWL